MHAIYLRVDLASPCENHLIDLLLSVAEVFKIVVYTSSLLLLPFVLEPTPSWPGAPPLKERAPQSRQ